MATKAIPEGYHTVTPYLAVDNAAQAIEYYQKAFGAKERARMDAPGGKIGHAELEISAELRHCLIIGLAAHYNAH